MIVLGIDPGTTLIGFGVIKNNKNSFECLDYGTITNPGKDRFLDFKNTSQKLTALIDKYHPDVVGIERLFFFKNKKTVMSVSEMRGVILLTIANKGVPIKEFTPLQIKQAISSYGRADKEQVQKMVRLVLNISEKIKPDDAADALAVAICCANTIVY